METVGRLDHVDLITLLIFRSYLVLAVLAGLIVHQLLMLLHNHLHLFFFLLWSNIEVVVQLLLGIYV